MSKKRDKNEPSSSGQAPQGKSSGSDVPATPQASGLGGIEARADAEAEPTATPAQSVSATAASAGLANSATEAVSGGAVIRSAWIVGVWTIVSRVLGLFRFRVMADVFGATGVADAFNFAFIFPNLTRRLFGEGLLSSVFVPVFSGQLAKGQRDEAFRTASVLLCRMFYWLSLGCIGVIALAFGARAVLPSIITFESHHYLQLSLLQWLLPYLIFINVAAVLMGVLNSLGHFAMPAFAPVLLNILMIAACLWVVPQFGDTPQEQIWAVAYAVLLGGVLQLLIQIPPALKRGFKFSLATNSSDPGYSEVMGNFKVVAWLVAIFQINVLMDNIIAQVFVGGTGPVTYLNMGTSVYQLVWSIIALALGTVALPQLSVLWAQEKKEDFAKLLLFVLRLCIFLAIPCTVGIVLLSDEIVRLLYGTGRFLENDAEPVRRTAGVALYSSLGLVFFSVNALLARALYAMKDMRTPTVTSAKSVALNLVLNLLFVAGLPLLTPSLQAAEANASGGFSKFLLHILVGLTTLHESGIALASTISNGWQTWVLARTVKQRLGSAGELMPTAGFVPLFAGYMLVGCAGALLAYRRFAGNPDWEGFVPFFAAAFGALVPFWFLSHQYFVGKLKEKPQEKDLSQHHYGVKEEHWPEALKFEHAIYTTIFASAIMGFLVWAVRDSVPAEGSTVAILQRALAPVVAGIFVYYTASGTGGVHSREYEAFRQALVQRLPRWMQ